jgi:HK97 family phage major capsid protein/HK97 family phage prohead protease
MDQPTEAITEEVSEAAPLDAPVERATAEGETFRRAEAVTCTRVAGDSDGRSMEFSFSSEYPVPRYFGNEVLSHEPGAADLSRLNDGAPLLWNHDPDRVIGVIERAWIDEAKKRGYVRAKFSRNAFAQEVMADVRDGILRNVSVGYTIGTLKERGGDFVATSWQSLEVSFVGIPADPSVGVSRSRPVQTAPATTSIPTATEAMEVQPTQDLEQVRAEAATAAVTAERSRISSITAICARHGMNDLAATLIENNKTVAETNAAVLDKIGSRAQAQQPVSESATDIGLSHREAGEFSFVRAIRALANPNDRGAQEAASFEREVGRATEAKTGRSAQGILVPNEVMRRNMSRALSVGSASAAGDLTGTDFRPESLIELLRNRLALGAVGVTTLTGLSGNVAIPRVTGAPTAYWVAESGSPTESNPTVDQINMSPKTLGAYTDISRKLLLQSSVDVELMVRSELATVLALEIDRVGLYGLGNTNQPLGLKLTTGINTTNFGAAQPTYAELVTMESEINADNADIGAMAYITNSTIYGGFKTTEKFSSTGFTVLEPGGTVNGYNVVRSNQITTGDVFFGVWNQMVLGLWSGLDLVVDTAALATAGGVRVIALQDVDYGVRHPEGFCRGNDTL